VKEKVPGGEEPAEVSQGSTDGKENEIKLKRGRKPKNTDVAVIDCEVEQQPGEETEKKIKVKRAKNKSLDTDDPVPPIVIEPIIGAGEEEVKKEDKVVKGGAKRTANERKTRRKMKRNSK